MRLHLNVMLGNGRIAITWVEFTPERIFLQNSNKLWQAAYPAIFHMGLTLMCVVLLMHLSHFGVV